MFEKGKTQKKNFNLLVFTFISAIIILSLQFASAAQSAVDLGTAGNFAILSTSGISNTGTSSIVGNVGANSASSTITGFSLISDSSNRFSTSSLVDGNVYASDYSSPTPSVTFSAVKDMQTAYDDAAGRTSPDFTDLNSGNIGGMNLPAGLYKWNTGVSITSDLVLSGNSSDVWILQVHGNLFMSSGTNIILSGGAQAKNVFWQVKGLTLLGSSSTFNGNILGNNQIVFDTGSTLNGRALALSSVSLKSDTLTSPNKNDFQSPITIATNVGNSWTNSDYNVTLNATSFNNTYIYQIIYSLNNISGQINGSSGNILINVIGNNTLTFYAVDSFSHSEVLKTVYPLLDEIAPNITSFNLSSSSVNVGGVITSSCIATDNVDSNVSINVTGIDISVAGNYTANCTATDFAGNTAVAYANYTVTTPTPTSTSNGNSGGGGGGSQCLTNWTCSDWSVCSNNIQTRTCNRIRSYCYAGAQPALNQTCTIPVNSQNNNESNSGASTSATSSGSNGAGAGITGAVTGALKNAGINSTVLAVIVLIGVGIYAFVVLAVKPRAI